jgi:alpha-D-xyloside xylohydrolase
MPYLFRTAMQAHENGTPMLRAMMLEFPGDSACEHLDLQYMLGDSLLVAPIFSHDGIVRFYVPDGSWTNLLTGTVIEGPRWIQEKHDFMSLPLLVRPNSVIPIGNQTDKPDYDYSENITLNIYQLENGKEIQVEIPSLDGKIETIFSIKRSGNSIDIQRQGSLKAWNVSLIGMETVDGSTTIKTLATNNELRIQLK